MVKSKILVLDSCGCKIRRHNSGELFIEYCPKHEAALDVYETLTHICDRLYGIAGNEQLVLPELYTLLKTLYREGYDAIAKANRSALAKAEGKEAK